MKAKVDQSKCISCEMCVSTCPQMFFMDDDYKAKAQTREVLPTETEAVLDAVSSCPTNAISAE